jgi:hypothetical protein
MYVYHMKQEKVFQFLIYFEGRNFLQIHFFQLLLFSKYVFSDCAEHPTHTINRFNEFRFATLIEYVQYIIKLNAGVTC